MFRIILIVLLLLSEKVIAQYFQYSQYNFTGVRVNPALAGNTSNAEVGFLHRSQNTGGDFKIESSILSGSYPLLNPSTGKPWSGFGLLLHSDRTAGVFQVQEAALSYAIHLSVGRLQSLSFGSSVLFQSRSVKLDGFTTGSQYVPDRGFDRFSFSGESFSQFRGSHTTFNMGFQWRQHNRKGKLLHALGFSLFDLNRPISSFSDVQFKTPLTGIANAAIQIYSLNNLSIIPEVLLNISNGNTVLNAGSRFQWELGKDPRTVGDRVELITRMVPGRSGIAGIQLHREALSLGVSYDFPIAKNPGNEGAVEIGLQLRKPLKTRQQKIREQKQAELAKKKAAAKRPTTKSNISNTDSILAVIPKDSIEKVSKTDSLSKVTARSKVGITVGPFAQQPMVVEKTILHFNFEFNSAELDDESEAYVNRLAKKLQEDESLTLIIEGHTDNVGSDKFNLRLSQKRADAVAHQLIKSGINPARIKSEGKGLREPLNENTTDKQRAENRRVVLTLLQE